MLFSMQSQTIYHAKTVNQPKNYFSTLKNTRFTASPVLEVSVAPYCSYLLLVKKSSKWQRMAKSSKKGIKRSK